MEAGELLIKALQSDDRKVVKKAIETLHQIAPQTHSGEQKAIDGLGAGRDYF